MRQSDGARAAMARRTQGKPVTSAQLEILRRLGCDKQPVDRAAASQLIDELRQAKGRR